MSNERHDARWNKTFGDIPVKARKVVARKLYEKIRNLRATGEFPYDAVQKRSQDKRKIWGSPWHLWSRGAAFVGDEKIVGRYYKGEYPGRSRKTISIMFSNKKQQKKRMFDYAEAALGQNMDITKHYLTRSELNNVILEALQEVW